MMNVGDGWWLEKVLMFSLRVELAVLPFLVDTTLFQSIEYMR